MLTIIGDVHGKFEHYKRVIKDKEYTLQLGDMGFNYDNLLDVDSTKHKFFPGNHDNFNTYKDYPHSLVSNNGCRDYGMTTFGGVDFFFIRGGHSIDKKRRTWGLDYFPEEELNYHEQLLCFEEYKNAKPDIVISHECPAEVNFMISNPQIIIQFGYPGNWCSDTARFMQICLETHRPKYWFHGHFHRELKLNVKGTDFYCIPELGTLTL